MTSRRSLLGLLIVGGSLVLTAWSIYHLMRTGTCASGGPYAIARPCPPGTGWHIAGLIGSILLAVAGWFVAPSPVLGLAWFGMLFNVIGGASLLVALGPASPPGSDTGGIVMGALFVAIVGVPSVLAALRLAATDRPAAGNNRPAPSPFGASMPGCVTVGFSPSSWPC